MEVGGGATDAPPLWKSKQEGISEGRNGVEIRSEWSILIFEKWDLLAMLKMES